MTTWYTAPIYDGEATFESFVLRCATAYFGPADGNGVAPQIQEYDGGFLEDAEEAEAQVSRLYEATPDALAKLMAVERAKAVAYHDAAVSIRNQRWDRYNGMIAKVTSWKPPKDLENLKPFMLKHLRESRDFDCYMPRFVDVWNVPVEEWRSQEIARLEKDAAYYRKRHGEESRRVESINRLVRELYEALGVAL